MPDTTDFRKTITSPTPLYFAAGVIEKVRTEAPEQLAKLAKVREADPKVVQSQVQDRFQGALATLDSDIKKLREQAQHYALQGVGYAAEAAVKAKEGYDTLAEQGKVAVETWRSKANANEVTYEATIEREPAASERPAAGSTSSAGTGTSKAGSSSTGVKNQSGINQSGTRSQAARAKSEPKSGSAGKTTEAKKSPGAASSKSTPKSGS